MRPFQNFAFIALTLINLSCSNKHSLRSYLIDDLSINPPEIILLVPLDRGCSGCTYLAISELANDQSIEKLVFIYYSIKDYNFFKLKNPELTSRSIFISAKDMPNFPKLDLSFPNKITLTEQGSTEVEVFKAFSF